MVNISKQDRRRLGVLKEEKYFEGPVGKKAKKAALRAFATMPPWLEVFLTVDIGEENTVNVDPSHVALSSENVFSLFGCADPGRKLRSVGVVRAWIRYGLDAKTTDVAQIANCSQQLASQVRSDWAEEIRALLAEAMYLGITSEEIYHETDPEYGEPRELIARFRALREARGDCGGMLRHEFERWALARWQEFKAENPHRFDAHHPPSWFVRRLTSQHS